MMDRNTEMLFEAAMQNRTEKVITLIEENGISTTSMNEQGRTIGHVAVDNANIDMLKYVVDKDPSILRIRDNEWYNIFHLAVKQGALDMVKYLVEKYNEDIFQIFPLDLSDTGTALHRAVKFGHLDMVKYFIGERNVDVNGCVWIQEQPPLFLAVEYEHPDIVNYLVDERNANLTLVHRNGANVLFSAVQKGNLNLIKHLLDERKASIDINSKTHIGVPLMMMAIESFHKFCGGPDEYDRKMEILRYLVEQKNADVNIRVGVSFTEDPLLHLVFRDDSVLKYLIEHGADINAVDSLGRNLLHKEPDMQSSLDLAPFLIKRGIDVNHEDSEGNTPVSLAIERSKYSFAACLIEGGADWKRHMNKIVAEWPRSRLIISFPETFDVNTTDQEGRTLLHFAAIRGQYDMCEELLIHCTNINRQDKLGNTALHYAAEASKLKLCKKLVAHGADIRVRNNRSQVPSDMVPAQNNLLKDFFEEFATALKKSLRVSVVDHFDADEVVPHNQVLPKLYDHEQRKIAGNNFHVQSQYWGGDSPISCTNVSSQLQNWFLFTQLLFRNAISGALPLKKKRGSAVFSASRTSLTSRMDPVAEYAINELPNI